MSKPYQTKFAKCPFLSTRGNKCVRKGVGSKCIYCKNVDRCPYYNAWLETRNVDCGACESLPDPLEVEDGK